MEVLAILNPSASRVDARTRDLVLRALGPRADLEAVETDHPFHATELSRQAAAEGARLVISIGGDGTANEVANGLVGSNTALWCLPAGSTNVFARTVGAPPRMRAAAEQLARHIDDPDVAPMTTGTIDGDRHFLFMSGIGVTAEMMRRVAAKPVLRARLGAGYVLWGAGTAIAQAARGRLPRVIVEAEGHAAAEAATVIIQRSDPLTFFGPRPVSVCPPQSLGDGTLSAAFADRAAPRDVGAIFWHLLRGETSRVTDHPRVTALERLPELTVRSLDGAPFGIEVDGCYMGDAGSVTYGISPDSVRLARARS